MKKTIILGLFLLPTLAFASFDRNLKVGMSGNDVADLQDILTTENCFSHSSTGYFGLVTFNAVKCFQTKNGIPNTGYVGALTRASLNNILNGVVVSSDEAERAETGSVTTITPSCPSGYSCTPVSQTPQPTIIVPIPTPTPTPSTSPLGGHDQGASITLTAPQCVENRPDIMPGNGKFRYIPFVITGDYGSYSLGGKRMLDGVQESLITNDGTKAGGLYLGSVPGDAKTYEVTYSLKLYSSRDQRGSVIAEKTGEVTLAPCN